MEEDFKKMQKQFERMQMAFNPNVMTQEEFFKAFEKVMVIFTAMKEANAKQMSLMDEKQKETIAQLESTITKTVSDITEMLKKENEQEISSTKKEMAKMMSDCMDMMSQMEDKMNEVEDGKDADEQKIIDELTKIIPKKEDILNEVEKDLPKLGEPIRDSLELIEGEENKLKIEAIGYLKQKLDKLEKLINSKISLGGGGGGLSVSALNLHLIDNEIVSGSGTTFTLANTPIPSSVKVYALGQRLKLTTDYSLVGRVITTVNSWGSGEITTDYRT